MNQIASAAETADNPDPNPNQEAGYWQPETPHDELGEARLRLAVGVLALEYAARQNADELSSRRFAKRVVAGNVSALLGLQKILELTLYRPSDLIRPSAALLPTSDNATHIDDFTEKGAREKPKRKVRRTPPIGSPPETVTGKIEIIEHYFPQLGEQQLAAVSKLARNLEHDLRELERHDMPNNFSRAAALLVQARGYLKRRAESPMKERTMFDISEALGVFFRKIEDRVNTITRSYITPDHSFAQSDLRAEAHIGLLEALEKFDLFSDGNVLTYCYSRMRGQMVDELRQSGYTIKRPRGDIRLIQTVDEAEHRGQIVSKELKEKAQEARENIRRTKLRSLDEPMGVIENLTLFDVIAQTRGEEDDYGIAEDKIDIDELISHLGGREQLVIRMRLGLPPYDDKDEYTFREIGDVLGVTESRVSQLMTKITKELKRLMTTSRIPSTEKEVEEGKLLETKRIQTASNEILTNRETELLALVANGMTNNEVAKELFIRTDTVKNHMRHISQKLGVHGLSRTHAIRKAYEFGIFKARTDGPTTQDGLGHREREVLHHISYGLNNQEIGKKMFLGEETIKTYVRRTLKKLHAKNRTHAVAIGFESGLLSQL